MLKKNKENSDARSNANFLNLIGDGIGYRNSADFEARNAPKSQPKSQSRQKGSKK